jgi:NADH:ubiquinone oxidoreductase subunit 5 (subunit L)/multisubunit Na+/H+ antiporter MnhA subunit
MGYFSIDISFFFDTLTAVMLFVVCLISSLVHLYSVEYMGSDTGFIRYMSYLSLFTFFMLLLVTADNFLQMFIG